MDADTTFVFEMAVILVTAGATAVIFSKLRLPVVIGYLAAGIILGPNLFEPSFISDMEIISALANAGIVLLMFTLGLEFNLRRLKKVGLFAALAGSVEIVLMITLGYGLGTLLGWSPVQSIFLGAVMSISSTAVIITVLTDSHLLKKEFAEAIVGLLIIEDIAAVIILTLASPLAAGDGITFSGIVLQVAYIGIFMGIILVLGLAMVPKLMDRLSKTCTAETLLIVSLGLCFGMAILAQFFGLSVAIGAFLMGIIISQSKAQERLEHRIAPIKEMFMALFFISIGVLIDPWLIMENIVVAVAIALIFILGKVFSVTVGTFISNKDARTSLMTGLGMVAMGEFSFVIAKTAFDLGAVDQLFYSSVIGAALITMLFLPASFHRAPKIINSMSRGLPGSVKESLHRIDHLRTDMSLWMNAHSDRRREVQRHIFWIFIDVVIIFVLQVLAVTFYDIVGLLGVDPEGVGFITYLVAIALLIVLMLPPLLNVLKRVRMMGFMLIRGVMEAGHFEEGAEGRLFKVFVDLMVAGIGVVLFFLFIPIAPQVEQFPSLLVFGVVVGMIISYLLWDANKSAYDRMCHILTECLQEE
ncbi:MAG: cation:proton antiporter [Methanomassiliicoccales archaeon]|nr:cation:proton antiporter [Methanomassiliicoccales archaeon]